MKKLVLLGDSIRENYGMRVKELMEGEYEVWQPDENCRFAAYTLRYVGIWKAQLKCGDEDMVHLNTGLWDCLTLPDGLPHTDLVVYRDNLHRICGDYDTNTKKCCPSSKSKDTREE